MVSIFVSHHSEAFINKFGFIHKDELGDLVCVVNSSSVTSKIDPALKFEVIEVNENIGFSAANNIGIRRALKNDPDYFLIINPDVKLPEKWLSKVKQVIDDIKFSNVGVFTVPLLGYDFENGKPSGLIDSLGIRHSWYGKWFDILQGQNVSKLNVSAQPHEVQAACGALMLIHKDAVNELLNQDGYVFNESYFMYKEDIELSIRVRKIDKKIIMIPSTPAFHCRGWATKRKKVAYWARLQSARNELNLHLKFYWLFLPYTLMKYIYVKFFEAGGMLSKKK